MSGDGPLIIARRSSHFSRVAMMFAGELHQKFEFRPVLDLTSERKVDYGGNPALRVPVMEYGRERWFGCLPIARKLWQISGACRRVPWPEQLGGALASNALELTVSGMSSEVALIMARMAARASSAPGGGAGAAPPPQLGKVDRSLSGSLEWLERKLPQILGSLSPERDVSYLEVCLYCFVDHLAWRDVLSLWPYPRLRGFRNEYARRPAAEATAYRFDA